MKNLIITVLLFMITTSSFAAVSNECFAIKNHLEFVTTRIKYTNSSQQERDAAKRELQNSKKWIERKYEAMRAIQDLPYIGVAVAGIVLYIKTRNASLTAQGVSVIALPFLIALAAKASHAIESALENLPFERQTEIHFIDEEIKELIKIDTQIEQGKTIDLINSLTKTQINLTYMSAQLSCEE